MIAEILTLAVLGFQGGQPIKELGLTESQSEFAAWKKQFSSKDRWIQTLPIGDGRYWIAYVRDGVVSSVEVVRELPGTDEKGKPSPSYWTCCTFNRAVAEGVSAKISTDKEFLVFYALKSKRIIMTFATR